MRRLHPGPPNDVDPTRFRDDLAAAPSWVAVNMISTVDGAATVDGRSVDLGGEGDHFGFRALRSVCDVVLVGAGTARVEHYGAPRLSDEDRARRRARGQRETPHVAIVTRSLDVSGISRLMGPDAEAQPIVLAPSVDPALADEVRDLGAQVLTIEGPREDFLPTVVRNLAEMGLHRVLCEGGPSLFGAMLSAGLVDHVFTTLDPRLVGGDAPRIVRWDVPFDVGLELVEVHLHGDELLLHHAVAKGA